MKTIGEYRRAGDTVSHPLSFSFDQNYPNPFNPSTSFSFGLPAASHVSLHVYNVLGQKVATVVDREYSAGRHRVVWDGVPSNGQQVGSGVYFARFRAGDHTVTRKMVVVK